MHTTSTSTINTNTQIIIIIITIIHRQEEETEQEPPEGGDVSLEDFIILDYKSKIRLFNKIQCNL